MRDQMTVVCILKLNQFFFIFQPFDSLVFEGQKKVCFSKDTRKNI